MSTELFPEELDGQHRHFAMFCFNACWDLIEKTNRTAEENRVMISLAMASRWHWTNVSTATPANAARSEWQVSRVYSLAGHGKLGLEHALHSLEICEKNGIGDFDLAFAHEAIARSYAAQGNMEKCREAMDAARMAAMNISEEDDRQHFEKELSTILRAYS